MKNLTIFSLLALAAIAMADLSAPGCTSQLRTVMIPIAHITHDLELHNLDQLSVDFQSFLSAVDGINTVCSPVIQKLMFQMRLDGASCESRYEVVLAKVQEFERSEVATDNDIISISTFLLSHIPTLQAICAKPSLEQLPEVESVEVEDNTPVVDSIEKPIPYQGFSDETPASLPAQIAPQQEEVTSAVSQQETSEDPYALTKDELDIVASILSHTPYGNAQLQQQVPVETTPEPVVETESEATPESKTAERIHELIDAVTSEAVPTPEPQPAAVVPEVKHEEAPPKLSSIFSKLIDAVHEAQAKTQEAEEPQSPPTQVEAPQEKKAPTLPSRIGLQISSKIIQKPVQETVATEEKKVNDDPRPECLATVYQSFSVLYMFQADAVAHDIKQLESDFKSLESITNGINSFCVPTINRDETFSGAGDCANELQTINDIIKKFKKNGPTNYLNVVDTIQNLWTVHKAFVNDCIDKEAQPVQQEQEVVETVPQSEPMTATLIAVPEDKCGSYYSEITGQLLKLAEASLEENLSEILSGLNDVKRTIFGINTYCDLRYRINVFPKGVLEAGNCEQDFVNMRSTFADSYMGNMEDLAKLTQNTWNLGLRLLHDC